MSEPLKSYYRYWGKANYTSEGGQSFHLLPYHCLDVAACAYKMLLKRSDLLNKLILISGFSETQLIGWLTFLYAIHDVGKFGEGFQCQIPELQTLLQKRTSNIPQTVRHDTLGYELLRLYLPDWLGRGDLEHRGGSKIRLWIAAVSGHHGRPPRNDANSALLLRDNFPAPVLEDVEKFVTETAELLLPDGCPIPKDGYGLTEKFKQVSWLVAGLAVAVDWLGSNSHWFPFVEMQMNLPDYWQSIALPQAQKAVAESGLSGAKPAAFQGISALFDYIDQPTHLQSWAADVPLTDGPQLFIFEELTGSGKTEAALILASRLMEAGYGSGVYIALPTMATADGMFDRLRLKERYKRLFAGDDLALVLAHSADRLKLALEEANRRDPAYGDNETETASRHCTAWLSDNRKKALLADFGVGTIDQALLSILATKHQSLRLLGLSSKVLIVDEVHACDAYMGDLLKRLLHFHAAMGGSAVLLSATLPQNQREGYIAAFAAGMDCDSQGPREKAYPLASHFSGNGLLEQPVQARSEVSRSVKVLYFSEEESVFAYIKNAVDRGHCIVWVRNTVFDAIAAWRKWQKEFPDIKPILFHARFALVDRLNIGKTLENDFGSKSVSASRQGKVVFATQVVEQSLDVDFDDMVTDLAPIDLIIQRAGRLQRHSRDASGNRISGKDQRGGATLAVLMPEAVENAKANWYSQLLPKARKVYPDHGKLWLTSDWLKTNGSFQMPEQARCMIETVYAGMTEFKVPEGLAKAVQEAEGARLGGQAMANLNSLIFEAGYDPTGINWKDDDNAPTRLGEKTVRVRLARVTENGLKPWAQTKTGMEWALSELTVSYTLIKGESRHCQAEVDAARKTMKDEGKFVVIIPLEKTDSGRWKGHAVNMKDEVIQISYTPVAGLYISKEEDDESDQ
ncbi:MAG: CRISPR-associated helicase Cas3' [Deltaproteobacteria bacterium]|nr:CRISPR-associated helicase Cas3' [Deltaproteobacteria bacterium]